MRISGAMTNSPSVTAGRISCEAEARKVSTSRAIRLSRRYRPVTVAGAGNDTSSRPTGEGEIPSRK